MRIFLLILFILIFRVCYPQSPILISEGIIKFERKEKSLQAADKSNIEFRTLHFVLSFNRHKAVYCQDKVNVETTAGLPGEDNIIFHDFYMHTCLRQKNIFGQFFLLESQFPEITWKITNEKRTILGFECRRANALILDSIYAIAFYTEDIIPSIGPESFSGLPGMIMGVVLPHKHISWFATHIESKKVPDTDITAPDNGLRKTPSELKELIRSRIGLSDSHLDDYLYLYLM